MRLNQLFKVAHQLQVLSLCQAGKVSVNISSHRFSLLRKPFFGTLPNDINGFSMDLGSLGDWFQWFLWACTIGKMMEWFQWIAQVTLDNAKSIAQALNVLNVF